MTKRSKVKACKSFILRLVLACLLVGTINWLFYGFTPNIWLEYLAIHTFEASAFMPQIVAIVASYFLVLRSLSGPLQRLAASLIIAIVSFFIMPLIAYQPHGYNLPLSSTELAVSYGLAASAVVWAWRKFTIVSP